MNNEKSLFSAKSLSQLGSSFVCLFNRKKQPTKTPPAVLNEFDIHNVPGINFEALSEKEPQQGTWFVMSFPRKQYEKKDEFYKRILANLVSMYGFPATADAETKYRKLEDFFYDCLGTKHSWDEVIFAHRGKESNESEIDILFYSVYPKPDFEAMFLKGKLIEVLQSYRDSAYAFINDAHAQWQSLNNQESASAIKERRAENPIYLDDVCEKLFSEKRGAITANKVGDPPTYEVRQLTPSL